MDKLILVVVMDVNLSCLSFIIKWVLSIICIIAYPLNCQDIFSLQHDGLEV
jgi:hypothetical protein